MNKQVRMNNASLQQQSVVFDQSILEFIELHHRGNGSLSPQPASLRQAMQVDHSLRLIITPSLALIGLLASSSVFAKYLRRGWSRQRDYALGLILCSFTVITVLLLNWMEWEGFVRVAGSGGRQQQQLMMTTNVFNCRIMNFIMHFMNLVIAWLCVINIVGRLPDAFVRHIGCLGWLASSNAHVNRFFFLFAVCSFGMVFNGWLVWWVMTEDTQMCQVPAHRQRLFNWAARFECVLVYGAPAAVIGWALGRATWHNHRLLHNAQRTLSHRPLVSGVESGLSLTTIAETGVDYNDQEPIYRAPVVAGEEESLCLGEQSRCYHKAVLLGVYFISLNVLPASMSVVATLPQPQRLSLLLVYLAFAAFVCQTVHHALLSVVYCA